MTTIFNFEINDVDGEIFKRIDNTEAFINKFGVLHNRKLFEEVGLFDIRFRICGDYELLMRKRLNSDFIDDYFIKMQDGGLSTTLKARDEAYKARKKNKIVPSFVNYLFHYRERWGYIIKHLFE